jgi:hypothetical protein
MNTQFEIEDAENLKLYLQKIRETLTTEWLTVTSAWQNLQVSWDDKQRDKFDDYFQQLTSNFQTIDQASEKHIQQLFEQIQIAQKRNEKLNSLTN